MFLTSFYIQGFHGETRADVDRLVFFRITNYFGNPEWFCFWKWNSEMAKDFSKGIYNSRRWRAVAKAYAESQHYICERCQNRSFAGTGRPAHFIVHHKEHLTPENVHDDNVVYGWVNLELLCIYCHNAVHSQGMDRECRFDDEGNPIVIIDHERR